MNWMCIHMYIDSVKGVGGGVHVHVFGNGRRVRVAYIYSLGEQAYKGIRCMMCI